MIRLLLLYTWRVLYKNPLKLIFIISAFVSFNMMGTFPTVKEQTKIESETTINGIEYNIFLGQNGNVVDYNLIRKTNSDIITEIKGDRYLVVYRNDYVGLFFTILFWSMLGLLLICFLWDILGDNDDTWFSFSDIMSDTIRDSINCVYEGDKYYYVLFGRLIDKGESKINMINHTFNLTSLRKYPKYKTPSDKRNHLIEKIIG